jgi:hypothetical protein
MVWFVICLFGIIIIGWGATILYADEYDKAWFLPCLFFVLCIGVMVSFDSMIEQEKQDIFDDLAAQGVIVVEQLAYDYVVIDD